MVDEHTAKSADAYRPRVYISSSTSCQSSEYSSFNLALIYFIA